MPLTLLFANPSAERLLQGRLEELRSRSLVGMLDESDRARVASALERGLRPRGPGPRQVQISARLANPFATQNWVELRVVPMEWEGQAALLALMTDITDRRRLEAKQAEREAVIQGAD